MSKIIGILILVAFLWAFMKFRALYTQVRRDTEGPSKEERAAQEAVAANALPALPTPQLEASLQQAVTGGSTALKIWLDKYGQYAPESRRSAIELDYAQMLVRSNPMEAKRVFQSAKARSGADPLLSDRIKKMEKTFQ
ncbi:MAG: hypothetical protein EXS36_00255 [Pedosphaera sp.]|nr:hypothetical protein [Pedosphaera sp.]